MFIQQAQNRRRRSVHRQGFTLVEVIVVVTIIALLATIVAPRVFSQIGNARVKVAKSEVAALASVIKLYALDTRMIDDDFDLEILLVPASEGGGANGPYLENPDDLIDPWDTAYVIVVPGEANFDFDVVSYGPDGRSGTEDDIVNGKK